MCLCLHHNLFIKTADGDTQKESQSVVKFCCFAITKAATAVLVPEMLVLVVVVGLLILQLMTRGYTRTHTAGERESLASLMRDEVRRRVSINHRSIECNNRIAGNRFRSSCPSCSHLLMNHS